MGTQAFGRNPTTAATQMESLGLGATPPIQMLGGSFVQI